MVCYYRALNRITVPDATPLPLIDEALDQVAGATIFSQIDLVGAYYQMRIKEEDCHKTAIRTGFGSFQWRFLCFGLCNPPAAFSRLIASALRHLNGRCLVLYIDDILVYSKSIEKHKRHIRQILLALRQNKLYAKLSKCAFGVRKVEFLGFNVSKKSVSTQDRLVSFIQDWPTPTIIKNIQQFVGLTNFYRGFVRGYADLLRPLTDLLRSHVFEWTPMQQSAFKAIKSALTSAPVLAHPDPTKPFILATDVSKYAVGATLSQDGHPVAFLSHQLSAAGSNWSIVDQELLAVMISIRVWSPYLRGRSFIVHTDHDPIQYLQSKLKLTARQCRWLDEL
eukprot:TRINITY_DN1564_c0_g2_i1.p1 TRINITY_DN1564_c0_g2~~TRINITY_DN1564_c0_g2_i1.p1  ORF type:complete len:336 (+),score=33.80 TRINITY_DN1564_c0_g2_i1:769-1776(+)